MSSWVPPGKLTHSSTKSLSHGAFSGRKTQGQHGASAATLSWTTLCGMTLTPDWRLSSWIRDWPLALSSI